VPPTATEHAAWLRARAAHPTLGVTEAELLGFIGERIGEAELAQRHVDDLYLACGCARGDAAALAILEHQTLPVVERGLASLKLSSDARRELVQVLRERMLVATGDGPPGIAAYDGRAPLAIWLRVCAARLGIRQLDRERRASDLEERQLEQLAPGVPNPELAYLRRLYGDQFQAAFREAVASLAPRERNLLRHSVIDELGIDQIAAIYHVHRATAARQLNQARETLVEATRERMRVALQVSETELESILRVIMSHADVTLRQILAKGRGHARESE
jgi:RNA polymerase sigma-70 factor (ECF subfamily)